MSKKLKIIIAIILALILALGIYIAPRVIPYTPPTPNIIKTDQGSFELRFTNYNKFSIESYREFEGYAKDYYFKINRVFKNKEVLITIFAPSLSLAYDGNPHFPIYLYSKLLNNDIDLNNTGNLFPATYSEEVINNKGVFIFQGFTYGENDSKYLTLDQILQTPEYQQYKSN
jgi:hypothetical protein